MKIGSGRPTAGSANVGAVAARPGVMPAAAAGAVARAEPRTIADAASVLGIPEAEFTPTVRTAIMGLMREIDRLRQDLTRSQARLAEIERLADQDALVPVNNRRAFMREMTRVLHFAGRYGSSASLIYFDLNGLKTINDTLGHTAGDTAIRAAADVLISNVRDFDVVGRLGGDEFAVVLAQTPIEPAREKARQLAEAMRARPVPWEGQMIRLDTAYGVYALSPDEDAAAALAAADQAMYQHKQKLKAARGLPPVGR